MENLFNTTSAQLKLILKEGNWSYILDKLCFVKENEVIIDYLYFKYFACEQTYNLILSTIVNNIDSVLNTNDNFVVHVNMKSLGVSDFEKHKLFIQNISDYFKQRYDGKLLKCYIYNAPFVFAQIFNVIVSFIDKETQGKIVVLNDKNKRTEKEPEVNDEI
jgi:hypothetical protein